MNEMRVLHTLGTLNRGGIETWLMNMLRNVDRSRIRMDFMITEMGAPHAFEEEARSLGAAVYHGPHLREPIAYARFMRGVLREVRYDVVHAHYGEGSGLPLRIARLEGVPQRIAHIHTGRSTINEPATHLPRLRSKVLRRWVHKHATLGFAISRACAVDLYGDAWWTDPRWQLLYYGIDLSPFRTSVTRTSVRSELGLGEDELVVGHVGRFDPPKNHAFMVDLLQHLVQREPRARLLLVGDGPLRAGIELAMKREGLSDNVLFTGVRDDVPRLMRGAMDAFVFPSLWEGLGLVLIEAQAAALPCTSSDIIPEEVEVVPNTLTRLSLSQGPGEWAAAVLKSIGTGSRDNREALARIDQSSFSLDRSVKKLQDAYLSYTKTNLGNAQNQRQTDSTMDMRHL